jgi:hypothetical protein
MGFGNYASGAGTGALTGASIGSMFGPGPGTAIGAGVGGLIGLFGGGMKDKQQQKQRELAALEIQNEPTMKAAGIGGTVRDQAPTDTSWGDLLQTAGAAAAQLQAAKTAEKADDLSKLYGQNIEAQTNMYNKATGGPVSWDEINKKINSKPALYSSLKSPSDFSNY